MDYDEEKSKLDLIVYFKKNSTFHCDNKILLQAVFIIIQDVLVEKSLFKNLNFVQLAQMPPDEKDLIYLYNLQLYIDNICIQSVNL